MHISKAEQINLTPTNPSHSAQPNHHQTTEGINFSLNVKRNKCRHQARIAKHSFMHISSYTTFIAQLITAKSLDNASPEIHHHAHKHKPTQPRRIQHAASRMHTHKDAVRPYLAIKYLKVSWRKKSINFRSSNTTPRITLPANLTATRALDDAA